MASTRIADHIGRVLGSRYRLVAPIGTGASAHVFLADDVRLARRVAVKVLHPALAGDAAFLKRFRAEARAAAALNHPHVLAVYDWGEEEDGPFIVTEFLGGGSLRAMLDRGHRLSLSQALEVGLEAARGLDYAHRRGLVHRDIKPANLLFDDEGRLRIADFGLARALAEAAWTEPTGAVLGTARYAAPEQVRGVPLDGKSDVYSLAVVLVEAVTGRVPFAADTTVGTILSRLERPLEVPEELGPMVPVLARAGQPDAANRPDAMALGAALQAIALKLPAPEKLPLPGLAVFDETQVIVDSDPTEMGVAAVSEDPTLPDGGKPPREMVPVADPTVAMPSPVSPPAPFEPAAAGERGRKRRWPKVVALSVLSVVFVVASAIAFVQAQIPTHPVPNVMNRGESQALDALKDLGFTVRTEKRFVDGTQQGQVVDQVPKPDVALKEGKLVRLTVSLGPTPVDVPDLTNLFQDEAEEKLTGAGLTLGSVTREYSETAEEGLVLDWSPKGVKHPKGGAVNLVVSRGPPPRPIPMVAGMSFDQAKKALEEVGLVAQRAERYDDEVAKDKAIGTRPPWGTSIAKGATVEVVISKGQPEVPSLLGRSESQAQAALEAAGLKLGNVYGPNGGRVVLSSPDAGSKVKSGTAVNIYLI
ncbi:MAG: PASTA domain-containing protein [Actinomycetota bacterium]|nr:PASTA domain-containing protein [Actinomycetota bacterium]